MIDTVSVWVPISPTLRQLSNWTSHSYYFPNSQSRGNFYKQARVNESATATFVYFPPNPPRYPYPRLSIEVSLPKVLFGNNVQMLSTRFQLDEAIDRLNLCISQIPWLPTLDVRTGILRRLDIAYNHQVGTYVQDYARALQKLDYPYRKTLPYLHEGVQFKSRVHITKFYDKHRECSLPTAQGILRQETTLRPTYYIERKLGMQYPTLMDLSFTWLAQILEKDLKRLHLENNILTDRSTANVVLVQKYGWSQANKLTGYLAVRQSMSKDQLLANGANSHTVRKYDNLISDAGISLALIDEGMSLPPLKIKGNDGKNMLFVVSDT